MSYELVIIPPSFTKHFSMETEKSSCIMCSEELQLKDEFINLTQFPGGDTEYEGLFSICPECKTPHLELLSGAVDFKSPVLIGWE